MKYCNVAMLQRLYSKKASKSNDTLTNIIKEFGDIFESFLAKNFNECIFLKQEIKVSPDD